jgi:hypothetical protein
MRTHVIIHPAESLTWDDVCQLWDNGVYTANDIKNIATLYFEGAELSAVLEVIQKVENESHTPEAMNPDPRIHLRHPPATDICTRVPRDLGFEGMRNSVEKWYFEPAWRGLH